MDLLRTAVERLLLSIRRVFMIQAMAIYIPMLPYGSVTDFVYVMSIIRSRMTALIQYFKMGGLPRQGSLARDRGTRTHA